MKPRLDSYITEPPVDEATRGSLFPKRAAMVGTRLVAELKAERGK